MRVAGHELSLDEAIVAAMALEDAVRLVPARTRDITPGLGVLSAREREVARLIAQGQTSQDIAEALVITRRTADTHAAHIREKLGLRSRAEIAAWATQQGLV